MKKEREERERVRDRKRRRWSLLAEGAERERRYKGKDGDIVCHDSSAKLKPWRGERRKNLRTYWFSILMEFDSGITESI